MPNWRKDKRRHRLSEGRCAFANCPHPQTLTFYDLGMCDTHQDYYFDEDMPDAILKHNLRIPIPEGAYEEAVARRRKFERERRRALKQAKEDVENEEFERDLFRTLNRREGARKRKVARDDGWVPDLDG